MAQATFTRRRLFKSLAATSLVALLPMRLRAEPITITAAIGVVVGIIGAIKSSKDQASFRRALSQINTKLDRLLLGQQAILDEIYRLRLFVSEALFQQFRQENEFELNALKNRYDFVLAQRRPNVADVKSLADDVQDKANTLGQFDFGAFVTFLTGVAMALVLRRIANTPLAQMKVLSVSFQDKLKGWLQADNPRGVVRAISLAQDETAIAQGALDAYPRSFIVGRDSITRGNKDCERTTTLAISGDLVTPFSGTTTVTIGKCFSNREHDPGPRCGGRGDCIQFLGVLSPDGGGGPDYSGVPEPFNDDQSPFAQVREANRLRNVVIASLRHERELAYVKAQIEKAAESLSS